MSIFYKTEGKILKVKDEDTLLNLCLRKKIPLNHSCEGHASCGTCRVHITEGVDRLPPRNKLEKDMADDRQFKNSERLACQLKINKNSSFQFILPGDSSGRV